jgi:hypothetical protein
MLKEFDRLSSFPRRLQPFGKLLIIFTKVYSINQLRT